MISTQQSEKKRSSSMAPASAHDSNKKHHLLNSSDAVITNASSISSFCQILELGSTLIWDFLSSSDVMSLLNSVSGKLSEGFTTKVALKAIEWLAIKNDTHLGRKCGCDWMRKLDFKARSKDNCTKRSPYILDETLPILQVPGGALAFLNALVVTANMVEIVENGCAISATFAPIICPLVSEKNIPRLAECTEDDVKRVMNEILSTSGTRFFKEFKTKRPAWTPGQFDFIDYHWDAIEGNECKYCEELAQTVQTEKSNLVTQISLDCRRIYQELKHTMMKNLHFVRFVPRPRTKMNYSHLQLVYEGLVAGITKDGILCGVYLVTGQHHLKCLMRSYWRS